MDFQDFKVSKDQASTAVIVTNISSSSTKEQVAEFFNFCGQIAQMELIPGENGTQKAGIQFSKETAARTALLLSSAIISDSQINVTPYIPNESTAAVTSAPPYTENAEVFLDAQEYQNELSQEDKPKFAVIVEVAAKGYILNDKIFEKAKEFDEQHGVTVQFEQYVTSIKEKGLELNEKYKISENVQKTLQDIDQKYKVQETIHQIDEKYHVKEKFDYATATASQLAHRALQSEAGIAFQGFLQKTWNTAKEINEDAKKQAEKEKRKSQTTTSVNLEPLPESVNPNPVDNLDHKQPLQ